MSGSSVLRGPGNGGFQSFGLSFICWPPTSRSPGRLRRMRTSWLTRWLNLKCLGRKPSEGKGRIEMTCAQFRATSGSSDTALLLYVYVCVSSRLRSCSWSGNALIVKHWELKVRCWLDVLRRNSFNRREQEVIWTVQVLQSVCRSQLFKKAPIFYGIRVLTIKFTIVGRLLLTPELLYAARKGMNRVGV